MKKHFILSCLLLASAAMLQAQELPKPSPVAKTTQTVGLTDITVEYSRPGVKGRKIWGDLVPYNEIWRAGANKATSFETKGDINVNGQKLPAGKYSIFILPKETGKWTVIFNKETELWGATDYKQENDQLRIEAEPTTLACDAERMEFHFINVDMKSAELALDWEKKRVALKIDADPSGQIESNITKALQESKEEDKWRVYRNAASYAEDQGNMTDKGLAWIEESVKLKETWYGYWVYAGLLSQKNDPKGAITKAEKAIELGKADAVKDGKEFTYTDDIQADIDKWKSMK